MSVSTLDIARVGLAIPFLFYGYACLFSRAMVAEFVRFGLPRMRVLIGCLEIAGAMGVAFGFRFPTIGLLATAGLALLMLGGVILRICIGDKLVQLLPAAFFLLLACYVLYAQTARFETVRTPLDAKRPFAAASHRLASFHARNGGEARPRNGGGAKPIVSAPHSTAIKISSCLKNQSVHGGSGIGRAKFRNSEVADGSGCLFG